MKGRRLSDSLVPSQGSAKNRTTDKYTEKSMPYTDTELFANLFSLYEFGGFWDGEQKLKALCIFYVERIGSCSP